MVAIRRKNNSYIGINKKDNDLLIDIGSLHNRAWELFGKDCCEICGMSLTEYTELTGRRFDMHNTLEPKDYTVLESQVWMTVCAMAYGNKCHYKVENNTTDEPA